jgi:hypothetical protein
MIDLLRKLNKEEAKPAAPAQSTAPQPAAPAAKAPPAAAGQDK